MRKSPQDRLAFPTLMNRVWLVGLVHLREQELGYMFNRLSAQFYFLGGSWIP